MKQKSMAEVISSRRKELGMTQRELAEKLNITDKAVSKWERGLACPDTGTIPRLAELLGISLDELMNATPAQTSGHRGAAYLTDLILKALPLAIASLFSVSMNLLVSLDST